MILVIFTGSRYADWRVAEKGRVLHGFRTAGINSSIQDENFINQLLNKNTELLYNAEKIRKIFFFGAGASSKERQEKIYKVFSTFFKNAKVKVSHDLDASALSTFGDEKGIIGIIGSGANAAYYTGKKVIANNYGLGYILADEGSTNWLGRILLKDFLTDLLPSVLREKFLAKHQVDRKMILERVYNSPNPNIFLTSFADFVFDNKQDPYIQGLVKRGLNLYVKTYLLPLAEQYPDSAVSFTGSVANNFSDQIKGIVAEHGLQVHSIIREPIQNLIKYYINKN
jgi:N-acetylglucosamine kinase-like BadF-type ATPase